MMRGVNRLVFRFRAELAFGRRESEGPADSALFLRDIVSHRACCLWAEGGLVTEHGVPKAIGNRTVYGLAGAGLVLTVMIMAALLGFHIKAPT